MYSARLNAMLNWACTQQRNQRRAELGVHSAVYSARLNAILNWACTQQSNQRRAELGVHSAVYLTWLNSVLNWACTDWRARLSSAQRAPPKYFVGANNTTDNIKVFTMW